MSSPPLSEPGHCAGLFFQAAGSFVSGLALASGSGSGSVSIPVRRGSSWRPGQPVAASGSSQRANWRWSRPPRRLTQLERLAGPSAPRLVTPHSLIDLTPRTQERAELRPRTRPHYTARSPNSSGSAFLLQSGSEVLVGIRQGLPDQPPLAEPRPNSLDLLPARDRPPDAGRHRCDAT